MGNYVSDKKNTRLIPIKCSFRTDADILARLDSVPNKQGYIKSLIRADIARNPAAPQTVDGTPSASESF